MIILLRAATTAGANYSIRYPEPGLFAGDVPQDPEAAVRRIKRHNCRLYLDQAGLGNALMALPKAVDLDLPVGSSAGKESDDDHTAGSFAEAAAKLPHRYRKILPYRWIPASFGHNLTRTKSRSASIEAALRDLGLSSEDSAALAKGVLAELIENGAEHSGASHVLLGGAIVQPATFEAMTEDFDLPFGARKVGLAMLPARIR